MRRKENKLRILLAKPSLCKGERNLLGSVPSMLSQAEHTSCEAYAFYVPYLLDSFKRHNKEGIQQAREGILKAY